MIASFNKPFEYFIKKYINEIVDSYEMTDEDKKYLFELWLKQIKPKKITYTKSTFTLTFGNRAENHKGMQIIGTKLDKGLSLDDLEDAKMYFARKGAETLIINLNEYLDEEGKSEDVEIAKLLVIKEGIKYIVNSDDLYNEVDKTPKDTKAFMYGRVVNKKARHNNCFSDFCQDPVYEEGKGTIINFKDVPLISKVRNEFPNIIPNNPGVNGLQCEGNYYYDVDKTFIGFHGDVEREIIIGVRLGADFNIYYQWYKNKTPKGRLFTYTLSHGDIYFMSEKTSGKDWKKSSIYTLRHAASRNPKFIGL